MITEPAPSSLGRSQLNRLLDATCIPGMPDDLRAAVMIATASAEPPAPDQEEPLRLTMWSGNAGPKAACVPIG